MINVFVQHPEASGISGFAISKGTPGLRQGPEALTMGMRGMVQNTVYLEGVAVSAAQLLGQPGQGMTVAQDAMMYGRLAIASACIGGMKRCAQLMLRYSSRRTVSTGRLLDNPITLSRLGGLTAQIEALSALVGWIAQRLDEGEAVSPEAYTACKILAPEFYWQAADDLVQCLGGRGYIETNMAPQMLRDARVLRIFEGPTETLAMHLGAQIFNPRAGFKAFLSQELAAPELAERLFAVAADILARYQHSQEAIMARRWAYLAVGELGAIALLLVIQQSTATASPRALSWTQLYFEQQLAQALQPTPNEAVTAAATATAEWVTSYTDTIGDIEQTLAGADHDLDTLLKRDSERRVHSRSNAPLPVLHKDSEERTQTPTAKSLEQWLLQWLAQHLKLSASAMDTHKAFADYGVDSIMAVELAQDIEEFLQLDCPLDATLAWNFPTIAALATHLATHASAQNFRKLGETEWNPTDPASLGAADALRNRQGLDDLSEVEMADALAAELAALQGRGGMMQSRDDRKPTLKGHRNLNAHPTNYRDLLREATLQIRSLRSELETTRQQQSEPIAIIGVACRFPGGADSPEAYWELLRNGVDAITDIPSQRWSVAAHYDPDAEAPGKMYTRSGGFINEVDQFDPQFFGISPREAHSLDPQQRLLLEVSYTALENAGQPPFDLRGSRTGVFIGVSFDDYAQLSVRSGDLTRIDAHSSLGNTRSIAAGRLAYTFGFQGPTMQLDTTCSSSLLAVHLACQSLRSGESNLALAGGRQPDAVSRTHHRLLQTQSPGPRWSLQNLRCRCRWLRARRGLWRRRAEAAVRCH